MTQPSAPNGAIYDIGYQHYDGPRLGRSGAVRALYWDGIRAVFGIGRGGMAKLPPIALIAMMIVPAVVQSAVTGMAGGAIQLFTHASYFRTTVWLFALFCAFQTPELVTGDAQHRTLALYFSRAVRRSDYVLARAASLATSLFCVALLPHLILLFGRWFSATDVLKSVRESVNVVPRILVGALAIALLLSAISLTLSALLKRRPLATAAILGIFILASAFVAPLVMNRPDQMRYAVLASPMFVGDGVTTWIFEVASPSDTTQSSTGETPSEPSSAQPGESRPVIVDSGTSHPPSPPNPPQRRQRRGGPLDTADLPGWAYLGALLGFVTISGVVLALRYRRVDV